MASSIHGSPPPSPKSPSSIEISLAKLNFRMANPPPSPPKPKQANPAKPIASSNKVTKAAQRQTSRPEPLRLNSYDKNNPTILVTGSIPTPKSGTPLSTNALYKIIHDHRNSNPETCGIVPPASWASCLSPSFLSPELHPAEQLEVKPAPNLAEVEGLGTGITGFYSDCDKDMGSADGSNDSYYSSDDEMEDDEEEGEREDQVDGGVALNHVQVNQVVVN